MRSAPLPVAPVTLAGKAKLVRIFVGESDTWRGKKLYDAIVEGLRANDMAGATVYRGIAGYGAHRRSHRESRLSLSSDMPIMIAVMDDEARIRDFCRCSSRWSTRGSSSFRTWTSSSTPIASRRRRRSRRETVRAPRR